MIETFPVGHDETKRPEVGVKIAGIDTCHAVVRLHGFTEPLMPGPGLRLVSLIHHDQRVGRSIKEKKPEFDILAVGIRRPNLIIVDSAGLVSAARQNEQTSKKQCWTV